MTTATIADLHAGDITHDESGAWRRIELGRICSGIIEWSHKHTPGLIIFAGDTFHSRKPQPWAYRSVQRLTDALRSSGWTLRIIPGNHDAVSFGTSPLEVVFDLEEIVSEFRFVEHDGLLFAFMPFMHGWGQQELAAALRASNYADVLITHYTIGGAEYSSGVQPNIGNPSDVTLPADVLSAFKLVVSGHIHKPQNFGNVIYPGSCFRHDFGEEFEDKRIIHFDSLDGIKSHMLEGVTPFKTYEWDDDPADASGKVVRISGEGIEPGPVAAAHIAEFRRAALAAGAVRVAKPAVTFTRREQRVRATVSATTEPSQALADYLASIGVEDRTPLLLAHEKLLEQVSE